MARHALLQVGLSFADVGLYLKGKQQAHRRFYLPQEPLGNSLKKFWSEHGHPDDLLVSSRLLEKILEAKLGGTVAQVVTSGFETWPVLSQPVFPERFDIRPFRQEPLASQELIFGLSERLDPQGQVLKALSLSELEFINSKLKLMNVKRVCVNLLFSNRNPTHQQQAAKYFIEQGFEVFSAVRGEKSTDEMPAWRRNLINACLSGAFGEHFEEIQKSFGDHQVPINFVNNEGQAFQNDKDHIAGSLFAWAHGLAHSFKSEAEQVLYLGLENWFLVSTKERSAFWKSPWGMIENSIPEIRKLKIQPTLEIGQGFWGGIQFSKNELGFEPGPMSFGRALKPTIFDVLIQKQALLLPQIQESGTKKFRDQMTAMIKNIPELENTNVEKLLQSLVRHLVHLVALESQFKTGKGSRKTVLTGPFAAFFFPLLKGIWFDSQLSLDGAANTRDLDGLLAFGGART